jgi:hypothetical protein
LGSTEGVYTSRGQVQSKKKTICTDVFLTQYGYLHRYRIPWSNSVLPLQIWVLTFTVLPAVMVTPLPALSFQNFQAKEAELLTGWIYLGFPQTMNPLTARGG